ncbi:MAG TPA: CHAD domain-containing protein [Methylomirabilota bacterium]|nr:CHAD domain-containing protein [Methylomirabilota bacterium]
MEVEAKFAVPDDPTFERLLALEVLGDYALVPAGEQQTTDRYLDTAGRDLLRSGHAFRRRAHPSGGPERVTVKGLGRVSGSVHRRPELEVEVPPGTPPERWPAGAPRDLVMRIVRDQPLVELITLRQRRTTRTVVRSDHPVAVLSLDEIQFVDGATARELEIELGPEGDDADLHALEKLLEPYGLRPESRSKFERALALVEGRVREGDGDRQARASGPPRGTARGKRKGGRSRLGILADDPMLEAGRKILRFHWEQTLAHEPGTIAGVDPEELHDMRVATRRQRAVLRILAPHGRRKSLRPVGDGLRTLGGSIGAVRDLDVLLAAAQAHQSTLTPAEAQGLQHLLEAWSRRRETARLRMMDHLRGQAHAVFKEQYTAFLDTPGAGASSDAEPRPTLVRHVLPYEIWRHYGELCAFERMLPWASVETLHALRIHGKRLRYLLEFFREVLGGSVEKPIQAMVALQDQLGELQDCVVTVGLVDDFLASAEAVADPAAAAAAGRYRETRRSRVDELRNGLERPWAGVAAVEFRTNLSRAVAHVQKLPHRAARARA